MNNRKLYFYVNTSDFFFQSNLESASIGIQTVGMEQAAPGQEASPGRTVSSILQYSGPHTNDMFTIQMDLYDKQMLN
jgi:hypothetical protein